MTRHLSTRVPRLRSLGTGHDVHVCAESERYGWKVTQGGQVLSRHRTQGNAVRAARREARRHRVDLVMHGRDGRIASKDSYGNEGATRDVEH
jgi:hypothetical protein